MERKTLYWVIGMTVGIFESIHIDPKSIFRTIFDDKIEEKICGGYAERPETGSSLLSSMVPAGGIEPTVHIENA